MPGIRPAAQVAVVSLALAAVVLTACTPPRGTGDSGASGTSRWVVDGGVLTTRTHGQTEHHVRCVPEAALSRSPLIDQPVWRDVVIPAAQAYTGRYQTGSACPDGPVRDASAASAP
ncbi:hypothetical protein GCM10010174_81060 [Kutzneria viridogrisea]|uniref:Lipoprotein n=1 Tax=Kutzneria viridogrisea TaxID=47990 RepID=A0ABR6BZV0_9PSEU|nr:hypothetical protein [Kutzneria viridogrisea]